ncbi:hypothetical protein HOD75_01300 [archaeon]|jgi:hypothetical protein|nr:hypothetical protein [archaeon]MBT4241514.1 hypothetical protein [archaeon]MBT4417615.1 hypothetical protein [archaeon]
MIKQNNLFSEAHYMCGVCSEAVTNPLCPICLTTEIEAWLTLYPDLGEKLLPKLKTYIYNLKNNLVESTQCIKCKDKKAEVCPYCFTELVLGELKKINASPFILREFFEFFNFDLHHRGYSKEAEALGVI